MKPSIPRNETKSGLSKVQRQARLIELLARGRFITDIASELNCSRVTLWRDRKELGDNPLVDEMLQIQLHEIDSCEDVETRLQHRGRLIAILKPHRVQSRVEAKEDTTITYRIVDELRGDGNNEPQE